MIDSFRHSHGSIRRLLAGERSASAVDALAIARIQLENLFTICYFLQSPESVRLHMKNAWKKTFIRFLLQRAEHACLQRFDQYFNHQAPEMIDRLQAISSVSDQSCA